MLPGDTFQKWAQCFGLNATGHWRLAAGDRWVLPALLLLAVVVGLAGRRLLTALLTLRAVAVAPVLSRPLSRLVKSLDYSDEEFLRADGAGERWVELRKLALDRLAAYFREAIVQSPSPGGNEVRAKLLQICASPTPTGFRFPLCGRCASDSIFVPW